MKHLIARFLICLTIFLIFQTDLRAAAVIDRTFGTNGTITTAINGINPYTSEVLFQPDGKYIALGTPIGDSVVLARFNNNGSPDTTFGAGGIVNFPSAGVIVTAGALQPDGKIVIVGSAALGISRDFLVMRFNTDGAVDSTFGNGGVKTVDQGSNDNFYAVALQPDGKIVAAGTTSDGGNRGAVLRFNANGSFDPTFAEQGLFYYSFPNNSTTRHSGFFDLQVLANGRLLLGATAFRAQPGDAFSRYFLLMLNGNGSIDGGFGSQGIATGGRNWFNATNDRINFEILPSGRIFVAFIGGVYVLNANGGLYKALPFEGVKTTLFADGKILVSSDFNDGQPTFSEIGGVKLYAEENVIGKAANLPDGRAFAMPDGKILFLSRNDAGNLTLTRIDRLTSLGTRLADFDRDDKTDVAFYRTGDSFFSTRHSRTGTVYAAYEQVTKIIPELVEITTSEGIIRRDAVVFWKNGTPSNTAPRFGGFNATGASFIFGEWGLPADIVVGGDFDGDASSDLTVFRPSDGVWYSMRSNGGHRFTRWGMSGDKPVPADYDYDGKTDYAIYRPSTGSWWIWRSSSDSYFIVQFGTAADIPLTGDYDGDGFADFTVYRPSEGVWYQYLTGAGYRIFQFGLPADVPVPGDYDGDGKHDAAVFRQGVWYILQSTDGAVKIVQWGDSTVEPVAVRYDQ